MYHLTLQRHALLTVGMIIGYVKKVDHLNGYAQVVTQNWKGVTDNESSLP